MSLLAPLYVLGALGIGLPILFHLIRRQPRGQRRFSSLMFLRPTPPTLTRRSRLDNLLLLLIRAAALIILAAAFARPFLRSPLLETNNETGQRLVMLVDVSASMRRSDLWQQANQVASDVLTNLKAADQIAIVSFDSQAKIEFGLEQSAALDLNARRDAATKSLKGLQPSWAASNLGDALIFAAEHLSTNEVINTDGNEPSTTSNDGGLIIVISDMQAGGEQNLKSLQAYSWPKSIKAELLTVLPKQRTNAVAVLLPPGEDTPGANVPKNPSAPNKDIQTTEGDNESPRTRVRVSNSDDATSADFTIAWANAAGERIESTALPVHVGPGENRIVRMLEPPTSMDVTRLTLVLAGDDHEFDNTRYVARPKPIDQQLLFIGPTSGESRASLLYYLQRAPLNNRQRNVLLESVLPSAIPETLDAKKIPLIVVADSIDQRSVPSLQRYVATGGHLLWVLDKTADLRAAQDSLRLIGDSPELSITEGQVSDYAMWSRIDFQHPLFSPLADARYNDFSKIRFWSHRKVEGLSSQWQRIADFDDGDPSIVELTVGSGRLWILTSGWQPSESQLALSTKFVPLLYGFFGAGIQSETDIDNLSIGDESPLIPSATATIQTAGGPPIPYRARKDFADVHEPGFYRFVDGDVDRSMAINVALSESRTQLLASDELERYGVVLGAVEDADTVLASKRQQRDIELESRQRIWQWLIVAVLVLIGLESWLSGYLDRRQIRQQAAI